MLSAFQGNSALQSRPKYQSLEMGARNILQYAGAGAFLYQACGRAIACANVCASMGLESY